MSAQQRCTFTQRSRRLAAHGIREWADVTHESGRWLRWDEVKARYIPYGTESDAKAYAEVTEELDKGRWEGIRDKWREVVRTGRAAVQKEQQGTTRQDVVYDVDDIIASRRSAPCNGVWEYLVRWDWRREGSGTKEVAWEPHARLVDPGGGQTEVRQKVARAQRERRVPESMYWRIHGEDGRVRDADGMTATQWRQALHGEMHEQGTGAAVRGMWSVFKRHAAAIHGKGRETAESINGPEMSRDEARRASAREHRENNEWRRTLYLGGWEEKPDIRRAQRRQRRR